MSVDQERAWTPGPAAMEAAVTAAAMRWDYLRQDDLEFDALSDYVLRLRRIGGVR